MYFLWLPRDLQGEASVEKLSTSLSAVLQWRHPPFPWILCPLIISETQFLPEFQWKSLICHYNYFRAVHVKLWNVLWRPESPLLSMLSLFPYEQPLCWKITRRATYVFCSFPLLSFVLKGPQKGWMKANDETTRCVGRSPICGWRI